MALSISVPHQLKSINTHFGMSEGLPDDLRVNLERNLEREQSLGNRLYRTITPDWFETHRGFIDTFIEDPNDPDLLEEIQQPMEGQASARLPSIQEDDLRHMHNPFAAEGFPNFPPIPPASHHSESPYQLSPVSIMEESHLTPLASATPVGGMSGTYSLPLESGLLMPHIGSSPAIAPVETPNKSASNTSKHPGLRSIRTSSRAPSRPDSAPLPSTSVESRRWSGEMPGLISLAEKAASLGAPNKMLSSKQGSQARLTSMDVSQTMSRSSDGAEGGAAEGLSGQHIPKKRGPGRRKRTEPVWVETEEGEKKLVSPNEYRMLRRRITNRMSARRMRAKHADEKEKVQETQADLQKQMDRQAVRMQEFVAQNEQLREALQKCVEERDYFRLECAKRQQYIEAQHAEQQMRGAYAEEAYMRPAASIQQHAHPAMQAGSPLVEGRRYHSREPSFGATLEAAQRPNRAQPLAEDSYAFSPHLMEKQAMQPQLVPGGTGMPSHDVFGVQQQEQMDYQMHSAAAPPDLYHPPHRM